MNPKILNLQASSLNSIPKLNPSPFAAHHHCVAGELIALAEMGEHMRISLIDPKWREQREAMVAKIRDSTAAGDDEITRNLVGLARTRPDIFGSTQEELRNAVSGPRDLNFQYLQECVFQYTTGDSLAGGTELCNGRSLTHRAWHVQAQ